MLETILSIVYVLGAVASIYGCVQNHNRRNGQ